MNSKTALTAILWAASLIATHAQLVIPSDGSDGPLNVAAGETVVIDLAKAITGPWNTKNADHAGQGVYDPDKWAVIFKYSSVNIEGTLTFANHPTRAPVVWLVNGSVQISGVVDVSGKNAVVGVEALTSAEPGPGGFRGGVTGPLGNGTGLGPGGSSSGQYLGWYGNPQVVPLIGGSGGQGTSGFYGGGPGGGAIFIASVAEIAINGKLKANGGTASNPGVSGPGSGGAIKLVAAKVSGIGQLEAHTGGYPAGANGRIRVETLQMSSALTFIPETVSVPPANPPIIWPPDSAPEVRVLRVDGVDSPSEPTAQLARSADIALQNDKPVEIVIETRNFPLEGAVELKAVGKFGGSGGWLRASYV